MDPYHELNTTFGGHIAQQWWADYLVWEKLLNAHPEIKQIVEIGTGAGGFSLYLAAQADIRDLDFATCDHALPTKPSAQTKLGYHFWPGNVFNDPLYTMIRKGVRIGPTVLHCDGGDKPREVREFATELRHGSLAVVHDYGVEFTDADIPPGLKVAHADLTESHGSLCRILIRC